MAEWGLGKDEFLATCLAVPTESTVDVIRVVCNGLFDADTNLTGERTLIEEVLAISADVSSPIVMIDRIPQDTSLTQEGASRQIANCVQLAEAILQQLPEARVIFCVRWIPLGSTLPVVELEPLDEADCKAYISIHPEGNNSLLDHQVFHKIYSKSDGVPIYLDRIMSDLRSVAIDDIVNPAEQDDFFVGDDSDFFCSSVAHAIGVLQSSNDAHVRRGVQALKALSVLSHGEKLGLIQKLEHKTIQHLDQRKPLHLSSINPLHALGLIRIIVLVDVKHSVTDPALDIGADWPRLLIVPRQIRDYIKRRMLSDEEYREIAKQAMDVFFGPKWREGEPSTGWIVRGDSGTSTSPFMVLTWLIRDALDRGDNLAFRRTLLVAESYIGTLREGARFRDLAIASDELMRVLDAGNHEGDASRVAYSLGYALRMLDLSKDALAAHERALAYNGPGVPKDWKANVHVGLSEVHLDLGDRREARFHAEKAMSLAAPGSSPHFHARFLLIRLDENATKAKAREQLRTLEDEARTHGCPRMADNVLLYIANDTKDPAARIRLRQRVIESKDGVYNFSRAAVANATDLVTSGRISDITEFDQRLLGSAYSYLHGQRLESLWQECHDALWAMGKTKQSLPFLARLVEFGTGFLRIIGKQDRAERYRQELQHLAPEDNLAVKRESGIFSYFFGIVIRRNGTRRQ